MYFEGRKSNQSYTEYIHKDVVDTAVVSGVQLGQTLAGISKPSWMQECSLDSKPKVAVVRYQHRLTSTM